MGNSFAGMAAPWSGASSASGGAGAPVAGWIDPDLLEEKWDDCECALCMGIMLEPASGCHEGHSFCRACFAKELRVRQKCPTCRDPVADEQKLVRNRPLAGMIAKLRLRCEHAEGGDEDAGAGPSGVPSAQLAPAASMTIEAVREELNLRGLDSTGGGAELVALLEEDRRKGAGCGWRGCVGGLAAHLGECAWAPVKCPNEGCTESPLRRDLPEHDATCEHRVTKCSQCGKQVERGLLAEHEGRCLRAIIECPNDGCSVEKQRGWMDQHRAVCEHEEVACLCPGCDARLIRKGMDEHVEATHQGSWARLLQSAWSQNAALEGKVASLQSEQRHAAALTAARMEPEAASPTSWVFNWRAEGWGPGKFMSESHAFGDGAKGSCTLSPSGTSVHSHCIGYTVEGGGKCTLHAMFSILDMHDMTLRQLHQIGTASAPVEHDFTDGLFWGRAFTPTPEEKAASVRADGSIRLRAEVRLFLDGAA